MCHRPWAVWANLITIIWVSLLLIAKAPFFLTLVSFGIDVAVLCYLYGVWLPPREAEWLRELRRQRYIPQADSRRRKKKLA